MNRSTSRLRRSRPSLKTRVVAQFSGRPKPCSRTTDACINNSDDFTSVLRSNGMLWFWLPNNWKEKNEEQGRGRKTSNEQNYTEEKRLRMGRGYQLPWSPYYSMATVIAWRDLVDRNPGGPARPAWANALFMKLIHFLRTAITTGTNFPSTIRIGQYLKPRQGICERRRPNHILFKFNGTFKGCILGSLLNA